jgi:hypothetical protein
MTIAETVALGLKTRSHTAEGLDALGITPTPEEHRALVQLRKFLERYTSNTLVRAASPEDRAQLEEFAQAFAPREDLFRDKYVADRIAAHAFAFVRLTTPPQPRGRR